MGNTLQRAVGRALRGSGGGGDEARTPVEAPDSLRSIAYAHIVDLVSEGEIVGFADPDHPLACVYLNETPIEGPSGNLNFHNIQVDLRPGTQTQDPLPNFDGVESDLAVGAEVEQGTPWVRSITNKNVDSVRVRMAVPALQRQDMENGDILGHSIHFAIDLQVDGGVWVQKISTAITGKTTTKYERAYRLELPPAATGWAIRVRRISSNSNSSSVQDTLLVDGITEIVEAKLRMPMSAVVRTVVDAEQFGSIPSRAFHLKGRVIRVPSNYDPVTRTYTGVWDGTFQSRYSNNPAWVFYDMALNDRYGLGHLVPAELVNKWSLYRISQYCDEMVADGFGGAEPRFTCNLYLQRQEDALKVMQDMATVFRGVIYAAGGGITGVADMPDDPIYTYTPANVIGGEFVYSGTSRKVRHTVALVTWNDPADFYRAKVEYVEDEEGIARYGVQQAEIVAVGCTSRSQARRWGRYMLATERLENDSISFSVGLDGTIPVPGKLINVADPLRAGIRTGGRIRMATINTVSVDALGVGVKVGDTLVVALPSNTIERRTIENITGDIIRVSADFSQIPVAQSVWAVDSDDTPLAQYRVLAVAERDDDTSMGFNVSAILHVPGKYAYADVGTPIETRPIPQLPPPEVPSPTGLNITQRDVRDQNTAVKIVTLMWDVVPVATSYEVQMRQGEGAWMNVGSVGYTNIDLPNVRPGPFEVQVTAVNVRGARSQPAFGGPFDITPVNNPPGFVDDIHSGMEVLEQIGLDNQAEIAQEIIDRIAGDAQVAADAAQSLADEAADRAAADLQVAQNAADQLLNAKLELEAAIQTEATIRQSEDESLASQIATISAGTGEQFDSADIWYFDTTSEGWTGPGTSVVDGWLEVAAGNAYVQSPVLEADTLTYRYVKTRVRNPDALTWRGEMQWITATDTSWDATKQIAIPEPLWDANGIATVDFKDIPWPEGVTAIRLHLFTTPTSAAYAHDWIALGRPSPGASAAALQEERTARIAGDAAEAAQRTTLAAQMRGGHTGTDIDALTSGLLYNERVARVTADEAIVSDITALESRLEDAEADLVLTASAVDTLETRVSSVEGVNTTQSDQITALDARITDAEGVNVAQATALTSLTARVTEAEGLIDSHTTQLSDLTAEIEGKASAAALTALTARVTDAEGEITSISGQLTSLDSRLTDAEGNITQQATALTNLETRVSDTEDGLESASTAITSLDARMGSAESSIDAGSSAISSLEARVTSAEGTIAATASSVAQLTADMGSQSASITQLMQVQAASRVAVVLDPSFEIRDDSWSLGDDTTITYSSTAARTGNYYLDAAAGTGNRQSVNAGRFRVEAGQQIRLWAWMRWGTSSLGGNGPTFGLMFFNEDGVDIGANQNVGIIPNANITGTFKRFDGVVTVPTNAAYASVFVAARHTSGGRLLVDDVGGEFVTAGEAEALASVSLVLNVNGYVTGWKMLNDGTTGSFDVVTDQFRLISPGGGARTEFSNGNWRVYDASGVLRVRMGVW